MKLSIFIPAHNEEDNITQVITKIIACVDLDYEIVVVNDHSTDATDEIVRKISQDNRRVRIIENNAAPGFANAIKTGFSNCHGETIVPVMADLCDDPNTIKLMHDKLEEGFDVVCGARYIRGGARLGGPKVKAFFSSFVGRSLYHLIGLPTRDIPNAFKMYKKKVIESIDPSTLRSKSFAISMEMSLAAYFLGFRITEVPTVWRERTKGKSNFKALRLFPEYLRLYLWAIAKKITS